MKRIAVVFIIIVSMLAIVSCSTTKATDVEPVVREVKISDFTAKEYNADQVYQMLERFVKDFYDDDEDLMVIYDKDAKSIVVTGLEFSSTVGALAEDGWIIVSLKFEAKDDKAVITMSFVDAYSIIHIGPFETSKSQGITEFGLRTLDYQSKYAADEFQYAISSYVYYIDNNLI
ncbi:MAG: DUF4468 domain-containing protein [Spirochaetales bacterium]|nr:DUF4468 domain-containing protein [Spirochaetales bacterium]